MKSKRRQQGQGAFDLIEEATQLLRTAPAVTLAAYYLGAIPFVLGLLFFWADMSRNPFASGHLADASLAMGLLFIWMKFWHVIFARLIRAQRAAQRPPALKFRAVVRIVVLQIIWQPSGLFLIPLSAIPVVTFPWVYGFYQNVTALSDGQERAAQVFKKSCRQAKLWPGQNAIALLILAAFTWYIFLNWTAVCFALPQLFKMLFGIESKFTQSPFSLFNSTFFAAMFGLTYLCADPILKTYYALRCFYGESLQSGEDLKADLSSSNRGGDSLSPQKVPVPVAQVSKPAVSPISKSASRPNADNRKLPDLATNYSVVEHGALGKWCYHRRAATQPADSRHARTIWEALKDFVIRSILRKVLECGGCDTAFEPAETSNSNNAVAPKAVSRSACHRTPGRKRGMEGSWYNLSKTAALILILSVLSLTTPAFAAQTAPAPATPSAISSSQLDGAIDQTIHKSKYIWRMPRQKFEDPDANEGPIGRFFDKIAEMLRKWARAFVHALGHLLRALIDWINKLLGRNNISYKDTSSGTGWITSVELLIWALITVVACGLAIFLYRVWRGRAKTRSAVATQAILPVPDVSDENVGADQLPEDEWMKLGRELLARGELRLAMRAFYLASLSHLAGRNLISITRFKSNREYERELRRRGHSFPDLLSVFGQNISVFEAIWYGTHQVNPDSVNQFALNVERIKTAG